MRAFAQNVELWTGSFAEIQSSLRQRIIDMTMWYSGMGNAAASQGDSLGFTTPDETAGYLDHYCPVRGTDRRRMTEDFLDHMLDAEVQTEWAKQEYVYASNPEATYPERVRDQYPQDNEAWKNITIADFTELAEYSSAFSEEFQAIQNAYSIVATTDIRNREVLGRLRERATSSSTLIVPLVIYELLFFLAPLAYLFRISLMEQTTAGAYVSGTFTLANYREVLLSPHFQDIVFLSLQFGVLVTLLTTLVVRLFSVLLLLSPIGPVNQLLTVIGILREPVLVVTNLFGATAGQVHTMFPYTVMPIYSVLATLDDQRVEAARNLGANEFQSFREIVLPHALPGITVGAILCFAWSFGAYAAPFLLGSTNGDTAAMEVYRLMTNPIQLATCDGACLRRARGRTGERRGAILSLPRQAG
jgi:ABC-type spermidine/putrescine transport system permease subunit I